LRYLDGTPPKRIAAHLGAVGRLQAGEALVEESFKEELGTCEYTVITHDDLTPGIFFKIAGVMAAQGLQILDAKIITRRILPISPAPALLDEFLIEIDPLRAESHPQSCARTCPCRAFGA
jgi:UTP:GlnB (protein PII) uridylyltransferase